jgi:tRNA (adenine57-N1/adenine58-N1)-methyltransferase
MHLNLHPGCIVLESGTGSGSLTHALARAVAPAGHVHTFEFHALRAEEARKEFAVHHLDKLITVALRNIEDKGFPEELAGKADGVFLDLPGPWKVVPSAAQCLKPDGKFCAFSPCIEQVSHSWRALAVGS